MARQNKDGSQPQGFAGFDDLISDVSEDLAAPPPKAKPATSANSNTTASRSEPVRTSPHQSNNSSQTASAAKTSTTHSSLTSQSAKSPNPPPVQPQARAKPEVQVVVEPKAVQNPGLQAAESATVRTIWFFIICGVLLIFAVINSSNKSNTNTNTSMTTPVQSRSAAIEPTREEPELNRYRVMSVHTGSSVIEPTRTEPAQTITRTEPAYTPVSSVQAANPTSQYQEVKPSKDFTTNIPIVAPSKPPMPEIKADPLIKEIQQRLSGLGYSPGPADGYSGQNTLSAVKQFQRENWLPIDGQINEQLLSNLKGAAPRVRQQRRQQEKSPRNESKSLPNPAQPEIQKATISPAADACPIGQICVNSGSESIPSSPKNIKPVEQLQKAPSNPLDKNKNSRVVCPTAIFCYPQQF